MIERIPIKKDHLFIAGVVVLAMISYRFAFRNTIEAWQINRQFKAQMAESGNPSYQPGYLKRKNYNLDSAIARYQADSSEFRNSTLSRMAIVSAKYNVKLSEVPVQDPSFNNEKFIVQKLTFEGDFYALTKALNELQKTRGVGVIRSLSYRLNKSAEGKLFADVYLEILK